MKTFIIVTILSVGVLLRPEMAPRGDSMEGENHQVVAEATTQTQRTMSALNDAEMSGIQGGLAECHEELGTNGDIYVSCCLDFWLFRLCFEVNWSAVTRVLPF